jgi:CRISPR-associated protein Cas2
MMHKRPYLIAYDIRHPRRLRCVHRVVKRFAIPIQYSVFLGRLSEVRLERLIRELRAEIDERFDDIRIYPIPTPAEVVLLCSQGLPNGIFLDDEQLYPFFQRSFNVPLEKRRAEEDSE